MSPKHVQDNRDVLGMVSCVVELAKAYSTPRAAREALLFRAGQLCRQLGFTGQEYTVNQV